MSSIRKVFIVAWTEITDMLRDTKLSLLMILMIFIYQYIVIPLMTNIEIMGTKIGLCEGFIAVTNQPLLQMIIPLVYLVIKSDFPDKYGESVFYIMRCGRGRWLISQFINSIISAIAYVGIIFLVVTLMLSMDMSFSFNNEWSLLITDFAEMYPEHAGNIGANLIGKSIYFQSSPTNAFILSYIFMVLNLVLLNMIQITAFAVGIDKVGLVICACLELFGAAFCNSSETIKWFFPTANSMFSQHYTDLLREPLFNIGDSLIYYIVAIGTLYIVGISFIEKAELASSHK